jgi:hypothetical protein
MIDPMVEAFLSKVMEVNVLDLKPGQILVFKIDVPALSDVHRRTVYDALKKVLESGYVQ